MFYLQDGTKIKHVQDTWRPLQLRFFAQAEAAAARAETMDAAAADDMLRAVSTNAGFSSIRHFRTLFFLHCFFC